MKEFCCEHEQDCVLGSLCNDVQWTYRHVFQRFATTRLSRWYSTADLVSLPSTDDDNNAVIDLRYSLSRHDQASKVEFLSASRSFKFEPLRRDRLDH